MMRKLLLLAILLFPVEGVDATCCCYAFHVDALIFKPHENGLAFGHKYEGEKAFANAFDPDAEGEFHYKTEVKSPDFHWNSGYRLGFQLDPCCSCLAFSAKWLHFRSHADEKAKGFSYNGAGSLFAGTWSAYSAPLINPESATLASVGKADISLVVDMVDVQVGHCIFPTNCLRVTPYIGVRFGWIPQTYELANSYTGEAIIHEEIELKNAFWGAGLLFGCEADYPIGCGLSLFASASAALLKGHFHIRERYYQEAKVDGSKKFLELEQKERVQLQRTIADLALGAHYTTCCFCYPVTIKLAWEQHLYFGQNQLQALALSQLSKDAGVGSFAPARGDLDLTGVSISFLVEY